MAIKSASLRRVTEGGLHPTYIILPLPHDKNNKKKYVCYNRRFLKNGFLYINMSDNKIHLPQSGGGIIRYFDEFKSKIELSPWMIIVLIVIIIILELIVQQTNLLGL